MTEAKKPHENLRASLTKRAVKAMAEAGTPIGKLTDAQKKTPSQRKSENLRKKLTTRDGHKAEKEIVQVDCRDCPKLPCTLNSNTCTEKLWTHRCHQCGQKVRYRFIEGVPWEYCPVCREGRG